MPFLCAQECLFVYFLWCSLHWWYLVALKFTYHGVGIEAPLTSISVINNTKSSFILLNILLVEYLDYRYDLWEGWHQVCLSIRVDVLICTSPYWTYCIGREPLLAMPLDTILCEHTVVDVAFAMLAVGTCFCTMCQFKLIKFFFVTEWFLHIKVRNWND